MYRLLLICCLLSCASFSYAQTDSVAPPIMGWSSWNTYRVHISHDLILRQARAMVSSGLAQHGYRYVNIDDGFFGRRSADGMLQSHPVRFPYGLRCVTDTIHQLGLKAGIYSDAGRVTCGSIWDADSIGIGAGLYGHEVADGRRFFNDWNFDFIKIDYCGAGQELDLDEEQRYTEIYNAFRKATDKPVQINICRWAFPGTWAARIATSWRISPDIAPDWRSVKSIIAKNMYLSAFARGGHYNDMDMLEVGRGLSPVEDHTHFGMWCMLSSPLLIGCDLTTLKPATLQLLTNAGLLSLSQNRLGLQAYVAQKQHGGYVFVKDLEQLRGTSRAVALYNPTDSAVSFSVALRTLELQGKTRVTNLTSGQRLKTCRDTLRDIVEPHATRFLRLDARSRLEPERYEAEWAYLPAYNDLGKKKKPVCFKHMNGASGDMGIANVGGSRENCAIWDRVYSQQGGTYRLTLHYQPKAHREMYVKVNDQTYPLGEVGGKGQLATYTLTVELQKGYNCIEMGSLYTWMPDLDCFELHPLSD